MLMFTAARVEGSLIRAECEFPGISGGKLIVIFFMAAIIIIYASFLRNKFPETLHYTSP